MRKSKTSRCGTLAAAESEATAAERDTAAETVESDVAAEAIEPDVAAGAVESDVAAQADPVLGGPRAANSAPERMRTRTFKYGAPVSRRVNQRMPDL